MSTDHDGFKVKTFDDDPDEWIDFVCACRDGETGFLDYDIIIGRVADDKVFRVVDLYRSGVWDKERALKEMRAYEKYDQIAFINQTAADRLLRFAGFTEV